MDLDGPALRIRAIGRAESRYPLSRVSRVISTPNVEWSTGALQGCLQYGISIVIVDKSGAPLGFLYPARARASRLAEDLDQLLGRPDWRSTYANWVRAERMRVFSEWRKSMEAATQLDPREYDDLIRKYVYRMDEAPLFAEATGIWRSWLCALVAALIRRAGLQPVHWGWGGEKLDLLHDLTRLLELRLRLEVRKSIERGLVGEAALVRVFHALSGSLEEQCARSLGSFARRVKQVLAQWL